VVFVLAAHFVPPSFALRLAQLFAALVVAVVVALVAALVALLVPALVARLGAIASSIRYCRSKADRGQCHRH
jgi:hypothetical protein